jgi:hypothetical protein
MARKAATAEPSVGQQHCTPRLALSRLNHHRHSHSPAGPAPALLPRETWGRDIAGTDAAQRVLNEGNVARSWAYQVAKHSLPNEFFAGCERAGRRPLPAIDHCAPERRSFRERTDDNSLLPWRFCAGSSGTIPRHSAAARGEVVHCPLHGAMRLDMRGGAPRAGRASEQAAGKAGPRLGCSNRAAAKAAISLQVIVGHRLLP